MRTLLVAAGLLVAASACSFDSGLSGSECSPDGKISEDGTRVCEDGFWISRDVSGGPDADVGDATGGETAGMDATSPPPDTEEDGGTGTAGDTTGTDGGGDGGPEDGGGTGDGGTTGDADGGDTRDGQTDGCVPMVWYVDSDMDGHGSSSSTKMACTQPGGYVGQKGDCDDGDSAVYPGATESCNGVDDDCDGNTDENLSQNCSNQQGVCSGSTVSCQMGSYPSCGASQYGSDYESNESTCDGKDNDCDGSTDENLPPQNCPKQKGVCSGATVSCQMGTIPSCGTAEYGSDYETNESSCDGLDNDCDGAIDEGCMCIYDPTESKNLDRDGSHNSGVCLGQTRDSSGVCQKPSDFEKQSSGETLCDNKDNDCDGSTDENITKSCYTGASGTKGTGICTGGTGTCTNGSFPSCSDTIQKSNPATSEVQCSNGQDDDCDGTTDDCFFRNSVTPSSYDDARVNDMAVDSSNGDIYVVGNGDPTSFTADDEAFVAKYDKNGNQQWISTLASDDIDARGIALDTTNSMVYMVGEADNAVDGNSVSGFTDGFIAKYDLSGNKQTVVTRGSSDDDIFEDIAYDPTDNAVVVGGDTEGSFAGNSNAGGNDALIVEYDTSLNRQWTAQFGTSDDDVVEALDVDANSGEVYAAGDTFAALESGYNYRGSGGDVFIAKYKSQGSGGSGQQRWVKQEGSSSDDDVRGISVDDGGAVYVVGEAEGNFQSLLHTGDDDAFLMKYSGGGSFKWLESVATNPHDDFDAVRFDSDSSTVYAVGSSGNTPDSTSNAGRYDVLVASYTTSGSRNWIELRGTAEGDDGRAVGSSTNSSLLAVGGIWNRQGFDGDGYLERIQ